MSGGTQAAPDQSPRHSAIWSGCLEILRKVWTFAHDFARFPRVPKVTPHARESAKIPDFWRDPPTPGDARPRLRKCPPHARESGHFSDFSQSCGKRRKVWRFCEKSSFVQISAIWSKSLRRVPPFRHQNLPFRPINSSILL